MNASATRPNPYRGGLPGNDECVNGWRGLTPLALNPLFGSAGAGTEFYDPAVIARDQVDALGRPRNVYGVDADGYAKSPWDNVGVQYGLQALTDGEHHAGRVPEAERDGRLLEGARRTWSRRAARSSPRSARTRPSSTRGARAT